MGEHLEGAAPPYPRHGGMSARVRMSKRADSHLRAGTPNLDRTS
jgi:hypothetical protein